jgi:DNA repair exonuclease SbcCD ATPase subunit
MPEENKSQPGGSEGLGSALRGAVEREADELGLDKVNFLKEALKWQYNWIGLAGAAAFALVSGTGLPLVLAAGLELMYLSLVPQSSRFRRLVRSWKYAEEKRRREVSLSALFLELPPELRKRYAELEAVCRDIRANYARLSSTSQMFVGQLDERLQGLLQAYLRLLSAARQHEEYLNIIDSAEIQHEVAQLQRTLDSGSPKVQEINRKRIEILTKRLEKFEKIRENCQVIEAQCSAIEDVLALIRDQSVTLRDPQEVSNQLENLLSDVEQTEETVRQVEAIFEVASPELAGIPPLPSTSSTAEPGATPRTRVRS